MSWLHSAVTCAFCTERSRVPSPFVMIAALRMSGELAGTSSAYPKTDVLYNRNAEVTCIETRS